MRALDVIGPIMYGPSSSHTAGACRLAFAVYEILHGNIKNALLELHGSFSMKNSADKVNRALIAGLLGWHPDDDRMNDAYRYLDDSNMNLTYRNVDLAKAHKNTVRFIVSNDEMKFAITGASVGGGMINISEINGVKIDIDNEKNNIIIFFNDLNAVIEVGKAITKFPDNEFELSVHKKEDEASGIIIVKTNRNVSIECMNTFHIIAGVFYVALCHKSE